MRFLLLVITLLTTLVPTELKSAPFTEDQNIQKQYEEFRQLDDADRHQTINSDDELAEAYLVYGQRALEAGDVENAINYFRAGSELKPDDGRFSTMLGLTYSRIDDRHLAEMSLLEAIRLLPTAREPRQILADHYYQSGRLPEAEEVLMEILRLYPDDSDISERLEQVRREISVETDMVKDVSSIFSVKFDEQIHADLADPVGEILQDAYAEQGSLLNHYPQQHIQVILYTRDDYDMATGAPPWSAGRFDGKIRLPVGSRQVGRADLRRILFHEYNHFLAQQLSQGKAPAWFYEGLAMVAEDTAPRVLEHFTAARRQGALLDFVDLEKSFGRLEHADALLAYEQSYSFVDYLLQQFGWHTLADLLTAFGTGLSVEKAFASVFNDFGLDYESLLYEWLEQK